MQTLTTFIGAALLATAFSLATASADSFIWTGGFGNNWNTADNWSPSQVPGAGDAASIPDGDTTVVIDSAALFSQLSIGSGASITVTNTTLNVAGGAFLTVAAGGELIIAADAFLTIAAGGELDIGGVVAKPRTLVVVGALTNAGTLNIAGDTKLEGPLTNTGRVNWTDGEINVVYENSQYGEIINTGSGEFYISCDMTMQSNGAPQFHNAGLLCKVDVTGITDIWVAIDNSGIVDAQSGTIQFSGGGNLGGRLQAATSAALYFCGGNFVLMESQDFQGPGQVGGYGEPTFTGQLTGTLGLYGGTVAAASNLTVASGGVLNMLGATTLYNGLVIATGGELNITAGVFADVKGFLANAGTLNITGDLNIYSPLSNTGVVNWLGGAINLYNDTVQAWSGEITNSGGGVFDISCDLTMANGAGTGTPQFSNVGTLRKSAAAGRTNVGVVFSNTGTVDVRAGTLGFDAAVTQHFETSLTAGTWLLSNDAQVDFTQGSDISINQAQVVLDGPSCAFTKFTDALVDNQGGITLSNGCSLATPAALTNSGAIRVDGAATSLSVTGTYTQTSGSTTLLNGSTITATTGFAITSGTLTGTGTLNGILIGTPTTLGAGSHLNMNIGGTVPGTQYDQLQVTGSLTVGGNLSGTFVNGFLSMVDPLDTFVLAEATGPITGSFSNITSGARLTTTDGQHSFAVHYGDGSPHGARKIVLANYSDAIAPVLSMPADMLLEATGPYGVMGVTYVVSANDAVDGVVVATATPASGYTFPLGDTQVDVSATDSAGYMATGHFHVTVMDTIGPLLTLPNITAEATGPGGAVVSFTDASASDAVDPSPTLEFNRVSGSMFPIGNTTVTATTRDFSNNPRTGSFTVTVQDTTKPVLTPPADIIVAATGMSGTAVLAELSAYDAVGCTVTSTPPNGSVFPLGVTTVNVTAMDAAGGSAYDSFTVTVVGMKTWSIVPARTYVPGSSASISGTISRAFDGSVILQASADLGQNDAWQDIGTITVHANSETPFGPITDPGSSGQAATFFRVKLP